MRKIILNILSIVLIFSVFSVMSVSAANPVAVTAETFTFGTPVVDGDTATIEVYVNTSNTAIEYIDSANFSFVTENCTISSMAALVDAGDNWVIGGSAVYGSSTGITGFTSPFAILKLTVAKTADNAKVSFAAGTYVEDSFSDNLTLTDASVAPSVELWKSAPAGPTVSDANIKYEGDTLTDRTGKEWTDVSVYTVSADVTGTANSLSCAITVNGKTKNEDVVAHLNGEKTKVSFRVAIVGAPIGEQAPLTSAVFTVQ